ncbi:conserved protein of unknown function (plasmid) [Paraburkholderia kururiensis]|uniref:hypothetical protein n=1 Tax=Paraburkholderia kururiensis TaxID=984307 RepID=UPI0039A4AAA5
MPITAYSFEARRELDLGQWLTLNGYLPKNDPELLSLPSELRAKAAVDIECSCCGAGGATLVRGAHSRGNGKAVAQGHFRFRTADGANPHDPLCDFFDEQAVRGTEYLFGFADDRSALTRAIRDLVCRGIGAGLFSAVDMHSMRQWFLHEKAAHAVVLDVTPEQLQWCVDMHAADAWSPASLPFMPEHGAIPGFDWNVAARLEWVRRNSDLFAEVERSVHFRRQTIERPLRLLGQHGGQIVLDPSALRERYEVACRLARFAAFYLFDPGATPPAIADQHPSLWGPAAHAVLAFCSLLLFVSDWDIQRASALFGRIKGVGPAPDAPDGNLIGLNPFHDYQAWQVINSARRVIAKRVDDRAVSVQIADVRGEMETAYRDWASRQ